MSLDDAPPVALPDNHTNPRTYCIPGTCSIISFDGLNPGSPVESRQSLGRASNLSLDPKCPLCTIIEKMLNNLSGTRIPYGDHLWISAMYTSCFYSRPASPRKLSLQSALPESKKYLSEGPGPTISYVLYYYEPDIGYPLRYTDILRSARSFGSISPVCDDEDNRSFHARNVEPNADISLYRGWLNFCKENHSLSCGISHTNNLYPLLMIDCKSRAVVEMMIVPVYIALSYVWGRTVPQSLFIQEGYAKALPLKTASTIEDAIVLTLALGVKYLWVDQFCIDQRNQETRQHQIRQMDFIYQNAWCTIVAAAGANADYGLPGVSFRPRSRSAVATVN